MPKKESPTVQPQSEGTLAIVSLVFGVVSLTGPGLLLGIPAIVTGVIALRKRQNRGLSIAGLVTGIVSTVISLLFVVVFAALTIWGLSQPAPDSNGGGPRQTDSPQQRFESSRT